MNGEEKDEGPQDPERTVHKPAAGPGADHAAPPAEPGGSWGPAPPPSGDDPPRTVLAGDGAEPPLSTPTDGAPPPFSSGSDGAATSFTGPRFAPRTSGAGIQVGDVLNHIFEVKRFIARGGMGEVFEGANVNSEERVAIKVMLPQLAADPQVISMFRREARTLTRLQHEALVSYRVLAQEPQLGVLYIVTEYIEGVNLADVLGSLKPSPAELAALLRRLASGLRSAHNLGAIHRDISPDNVLLEGGQLGNATIIDFGIAKDLDPTSSTIVGEGFAGKLSYVAPEQLGDYGREIGPWTDVYSLALVMLAVAGGRHIGFGGSLVEAVDKRRIGPDTKAAPEELRPLLGRMLKANPAERLRSMDEVLDMLDQVGSVARPSQRTRFALRGFSLRLGALPRPVLIGASAAALLLVLLVVLLLVSSGGGPTRNDMASVPTPAPGPGTAPIAISDLVERARAAVGSALPQVRCSWLDVVDVTGDAGQVTVNMAGVAGSTASAQSDVQRALEAAGIRANLNLEAVAPIQPALCSALDTYRLIHAPEGGHISVTQREFEIERQADGQTESRPLIDVAIDDPALDFTAFLIEPTGDYSVLFSSRAHFQRELAQNTGAVSSQGADRYNVTLRVPYAGWTGLLLITGAGPFDEQITAPALAARGPEWTSSFMSVATRRHWHTEMVWFNSVDRQPNVPVPAQPQAPANASAGTNR